MVPHNLEILLFWGGSMNIQRVSKLGFEMYWQNIFPNQNLALMLNFQKTQVIQRNIYARE